MVAFPFRTGVVSACLLASSPALAITQPNGTPIPVGTSLQQYLTSQGETINPSTQAAVTPETFTPGCALTFTVIARDSGYMNAFGWYNVTGSKPSVSELYEFIACTDGVGTSKPLDVRKDPRYTGGDIGFFEHTPQNGTTGNCASGTTGTFFFSQRLYNPDNSSYHLLIMDSKVYPNAFYFAWEDLLTNNDNDFQDLLMRVEGIQCTGGGTPCPTGALGICAYGAEQCVDGVLQCVQTTKPQTEICNNIDDDCSGSVDDAPNLCPTNYVCDRGSCVPMCSSGEYPCKPGELCTTEGVCVEQACATVTCDTGKICKAGTCVGGCDGITCPYGQVCNSGICFDPCAGVSCPDAKDHCENGVCVKGCQCGGCPNSLVCTSGGLCIAQACLGVGCNPGMHCDATSGLCIDNCQGAVCPTGQICQSGNCIDNPDAGTGGAGGSDAGVVILGGSSGSGGSGAGASGGSGGSSASGGTGLPFGAPPPSSGDSGGCGCRNASTTSAATSPLFALLALATAALRRSRRRGPKKHADHVA